MKKCKLKHQKNEYQAHLNTKFKTYQSKLHSPEKEIFDEYTPKLATTTYGSEEYKTYLEEMKVALSHHYSKNRHHPEYHPNGIHDMNLVDLIEMLCDWKAATMRHNDGDIIKSIELNQKRFGYDDEIKQIMINGEFFSFGQKILPLFAPRKLLNLAN